MDKFKSSEDTDTSDDEYVPGEKPEEVVSEIDSDGDSEEALSETENAEKNGKNRSRSTVKSRKRRKETSNKEATETMNKIRKEPTEEEKKKLQEDIWADFMKDTDFRSRHSKSSSSTTSSKITGTEKSTDDKVKITEFFEFAGEKVAVEKEVSKKLLESTDKKNETLIKGKKTSGLGSVLGQLGKKSKINTLEKSKLDWDKFKKEENLDDDLQNYNKGKSGYLERQDFLQRADLRRFEIEKGMRTIERSKRTNNI